MPFINIGNNANDLTIQVPTRGTTDWADEFLQNFAQKISDHDHTGGGRGAALGSGAFADSSINGDKILLNNDTTLKWRNSLGTITDITKYSLQDIYEILVPLKVQSIESSKTVSIVNNTNDQLILELGAAESLELKYKIKRLGAVNLDESGSIEINLKDGSHVFHVETIGKSMSGASFKIAGTQLLLDLTDNAGSVLETMNLLDIKVG